MNHNTLPTNQPNDLSYLYIKNVIITKLQTDDQKHLLDFESYFTAFIASNELTQSRTFECRRSCELFELVSALFSVQVTREHVEQSLFFLVLQRTDSSKIPDFKLSQFLNSTPQIKVLRRQTDLTSTDSTSLKSQANDDSSGRAENDLISLKEREEIYSKARARIFGDSADEPIEDTSSEFDRRSVLPDRPTPSTTVHWDGGHAAESYYNDDSAFVRIKRPEPITYGEYPPFMHPVSYSVGNEYGFYPPPSFYPQSSNCPRPGMLYGPGMYGTSYMGNSPGMYYNPPPDGYGGPPMGANNYGSSFNQSYMQSGGSGGYMMPGYMDPRYPPPNGNYVVGQLPYQQPPPPTPTQKKNIPPNLY